MRIILLAVFTIAVRMMRKIKIASPFIVLGLILLFPAFLFLADYALQLVLRGFVKSLMLTCAVYTAYAIMTELLTVLVYCALYKYSVGESGGVAVILKKLPKMVLITVSVLILLSGALYFVHNLGLATIAQSIPSMFENGATSVLSVMTSMNSFVILKYLRYAISIAIAALMLYGCQKSAIILTVDQNAFGDK